MFRSRKLINRLLLTVTLALILALFILVVLSPADARLGNIVKLAYLHGALTWVGLFTFSAAGVLGLVALVLRRDVWYNGTRAAGLAALIVWTLYVLSAMAITALTWGQLIAWNEPRVRATGLIFLAAIALAIVARLVGSRDFTAAVNLLLGIVPWVVVRQAEAIRHPADPIGGSPSASIQQFYALIVLAVAGLALTLTAWLWTSLELRETPGQGREQSS
jgi:hypothetical protein